MTDKNFEKQKKRVTKYVTKWRQLFGLWEWRGDAFYEDSNKPGPVAGTESLADCYADWKYLNYQITFYLPSLLNKSDRDIERTVVHEMLHIVVNEMREKDIKHEERVVSHLTNIMEWVYAAQNKNNRSVNNKQTKRINKKSKSKTKKAV